MTLSSNSFTIISCFLLDKKSCTMQLFSIVTKAPPFQARCLTAHPIILFHFLKKLQYKLPVLRTKRKFMVCVEFSSFSEHFRICMRIETFLLYVSEINALVSLLPCRKIVIVYSMLEKEFILVCKALARSVHENTKKAPQAICEALNNLRINLIISLRTVVHDVQP